MNICIVGAGPAGLCAAKEIKEANPEATVVICEKSLVIGGVFSRGYHGLTLVNNPLLVNFSDFLAADALPELRMWSAQEYVSYLEKYAKHNNVLSLIRFDTTVEAAQWSDSGWHLQLRVSGVVENMQCDYLVLCSGIHHSPNIPQIEGQEKFIGTMMHARDVTTFESFKDQRVLFVGLGETGSDLCHAIAPHAKDCAISVRRWPGYFIPRYHDNRPTDLDTSKLYHCLPITIDDSLLGFLLKMKRWFEYRRLKSFTDITIQEAANKFNNQWPETVRLGPFRRISTKSCGFLRAYSNNHLALKPAIRSMDKDVIYFVDGSQMSVDVVIFCTGYRQSFAYLQEPVMSTGLRSSGCYRYIFPPGWQDHLAMIGFIRPAIGAIPVIAELQSRLLALYLSGKVHLPREDQMLKVIAAQKSKSMNDFPVDIERIEHLVDYYSYLKQLASDIGVMPRQWRLFWSRPRLWYKANFACLCPGIFRLHGVGNRPKEVGPVLERLPTMPWPVLVFEIVVYGLCRCLALFGLKKYAVK